MEDANATNSVFLALDCVAANVRFNLIGASKMMLGLCKRVTVSVSKISPPTVVAATIYMYYKLNSHGYLAGLTAGLTAVLNLFYFYT